MRLNEKERRVILEAATRRFGDGVRVWLFGSRADDHGRGGDIDLLVETAAPVVDPLARSLAMEVDIQSALDDPKVDILVMDRSRPLQPMQRIALESGVAL